jgi:glucan biosynthesis protein
VNNTLFKNDGKNTGSGEFQIQYHATNNVFKNNIAYATSQGLLINSYTNSTSNPADVNYNLYFSPLNAVNATFVWVGKTYTGFTTYQTATGKDNNSIYADPLFVNMSTPDLHVQPNSPAVNAGINLGPKVVGTVDFAGNPRVQGSNIDIGAYEQP